MTILPDEDALRTGKKKKWWKEKYPLPYWCVYIAWAMAVLDIAVCSFFTILYSLEWGASKSNKWLSVFIFSFAESVMVVQPVKVKSKLIYQIELSA